MALRSGFRFTAERQYNDDIGHSLCGNRRTGTSAAKAARLGDINGVAEATPHKDYRAKRRPYCRICDSKLIPAKSLFGFGLLGHRLGGRFRDFHECQLQTSQNFDEKLVVFLGQISVSLFAESVKHVDYFACAFEIDERAAGLRVSHSTEHGGSVAGEEVHQHLKTA